MTITTCTTAPMKIYTPSTEELAEIAYTAMIDTMNESLDNGSHGAGTWNEGMECNPRWHLCRVVRHGMQALMLLDNLDLKDQESVYQHTRNALARCCLALAQLGKK